MISLLISTIGGLVLHQSRQLTRRMPDGWREIASYSMGVAGSLPFVGLFWWRLREMPNQTKRAFVSYLLGFLGVGAGVAMGWLVDALRGEDADE